MANPFLGVGWVGVHSSLCFRTATTKRQRINDVWAMVVCSEGVAPFLVTLTFEVLRELAISQN